MLYQNVHSQRKISNAQYRQSSIISTVFFKARKGFGFPNSCKKTVADTWTSDPTLYEAPCNARSIGTTLIVSGPLHLRSSGTGHALGRSSAFSAESFFQMVMQKSDSLRTKAVGVPHPP